MVEQGEDLVESLRFTHRSRRRDRRRLGHQRGGNLNHRRIWTSFLEILGEQLVEPVRDGLHVSVLVAVLVQQPPVANLEAEMVDGIGHGVDRVLAAEDPRRRAFIPHEMEARFDPSAPSSP
ncbi:hypothetical protein Pan216_13190 [Planctomycetes bacterium Pan216]|uniref:Uncharacterized protein n=1 Tax=Kolteria novifilia TaxID=2527975 RepID=A0A518B0G7_9BACT|nr:hypothetical protein Pan216_13190 [Planctomycetes bacterium Pan216]